MDPAVAKKNHQEKFSRGKRMRLAKKLGAIVCMLSAHVLLASTCPVDLYTGREVPELAGKKIQNIKAYKFDGKAWSVAPIQIVDRHTGMPQNTKATRQSRVILESKHFGKKAPARAHAECKKQKVPLSLVELPAEKSFLYVGTCSLPTKNVQKPAPKFSYIPKLRKFETPGIRYVHKETNEFLFTESYFKVADKWELVAKNAGFNMYLNPKRFIPINFDDTRVQTKMHEFKSGANALSASLSFYLKFLFFKINLRTDSNATFFENSVHLPMVFKVPFDVKNRLKHRSGFLFFWENTGLRYHGLDSGKSIPVLDYQKHKPGDQSLVKKALQFCGGRSCTYSIRASTGAGTPFLVQMQIPKYMVEKGFFPMHVPKPKQFIKKMGWKWKKDLTGHQAIYHEGSTITKGLHRLDIWISFDGEKTTRSGAKTCPQVFKLTKV